MPAFPVRAATAGFKTAIYEQLARIGKAVAHPCRLEQLAEWTEWADKTLVF